MIPEMQARLRTAPDTPFRLVAGATALAQVKDRPVTMPAAFVIPLEDASEPNSRMAGPVLQRTQADVGVIIICENMSDPLGQAVTDDLTELKKFVRRNFIGFVPNERCDPVEHVSGSILRARSGTVWFQDIFATAYYQEEDSTP
ncbi:hypothetical protein HB780_05455 (plasmid) [Rhizobium lusitanum]|uniref:phage tail terminator protein n=1 Tax=Rhizobium lusitanum TaxID=293958 RepID=UPI00161657C3|nr:hypothetical protein [Rhizobium lusitanum]QND45202.1 hypothetical protein HB780_05455 [Rhizobium lusitanum]